MDPMAVSSLAPMKNRSASYNSKLDDRDGGMILGRISALLVVALATVSCAPPPPPPPPPPTIVNLTLTAAETLNPNAGGRSAPVLVRVYELENPSAFEKADFFQLFEKDSAALGGSMKAREELTLAPGASRTMTRTMTSGAKFIAVFAAFRDYENATWRAVVAVPDNKTTPITVTLRDRLLAVAAAAGS